MKHHKNHEKAQAARLQVVPVHFEFSHPAVISVLLKGTLNRRQAAAKPLRFLLNGQWLADPLAKDHLPNPFGGTVSF
jgi:hypothetical protein